MTLQTKYKFTHDPLQQGMISSCIPCEKITAFSNEELEFGLGVAYAGEVGDGNSPKVALPSATGFYFAGITCHTHKQNKGSDDRLDVIEGTDKANYAIGDDITLLKKGRIMVWSEQAVEPGDPVFLRHTVNGAGTASGQFRKDVDAANADQIANAQWVGKIATAGRVELEINLP